MNAKCRLTVILMNITRYFLNLNSDFEQAVNAILISAQLQITIKLLFSHRGGLQCGSSMQIGPVRTILLSRIESLTGPNFIALLNGKQICVLTVAEKKIA